MGTIETANQTVGELRQIALVLRQIIDEERRGVALYDENEAQEIKRLQAQCEAMKAGTTALFDYLRRRAQDKIVRLENELECLGGEPVQGQEEAA